jgi:hypothetical protein
MAAQITADSDDDDDDKDDDDDDDDDDSDDSDDDDSNIQDSKSVVVESRLDKEDVNPESIVQKRNAKASASF